MLWRRMRMRHPRISRPLPDFDRPAAALVNDLIEAAIESGQSLGDSVLALGWCWRCRWRRRRCNATGLCVGARHAFELARQRIKTLVDGSEVFADVIPVIRFPV